MRLISEDNAADLKYALDHLADSVLSRDHWMRCARRANTAIDREHYVALARQCNRTARRQRRSITLRMTRFAMPDLSLLGTEEH